MDVVPVYLRGIATAPTAPGIRSVPSHRVDAESSQPSRGGLLLITALTLFALGVHGYHPFVEDGGLYAAGIKKLLNPSLYPHWTAFVTEHLRFSLFAPAVASLVRASGLPLETALFALYILSIWLTLFAGWMVALRLFDEQAARVGAVALLACWLTLPIAGTALMLVDPYVTARSFSTPLLLMAVAWTLDLVAADALAAWPIAGCASALLLAALLHPLMAGYGFAAVVTLLWLGAPSPGLRRLAPAGLLALAVLLAGGLQALAPSESASYVSAALSRYYWFPARWTWYEQAGLLAPVLLLLLLGRRPPRPSVTLLARAGVALAAISAVVAVVFCREDAATHLVARLQPLRSLQIVYEWMTLLLGGWLGAKVLQRRPWRWGVLLIVVGAIMLTVQRETFPDLAPVEWPGAAQRNPWAQAFLWVRENTPGDALFALDADYITSGKKEDAQSFRALAERSALADYSKDGGEASITPQLTDIWVAGVTAQEGLESEPDAERVARLRPFGVDWVVLASGSQTAWACPYRNQAVKVCRLP